MAKKDYKKKTEDLKMFEIGQLPPQALELENAVLGAIMLESTCLERIILDFTTNLFYKDIHRDICGAILELYHKSEPVDILTVTQKLKQDGNLEKVGGPYYIAQLTNRVAGSANIEFHIKILQQNFLLRNMIQISSQAIRKAYDAHEDVFDVYAEMQVGLDEALKNIMHYELKKVKDIHQEIIAESIEVNKKGTKSGIPCGLRMVDNVTNGWQKSDLIIIAGRPSMGKTAAAVSMAMYPAIERNIPVAIFSCEMSNQQLVSRMQSHISQVNVSRIVKKQLSIDEITLIQNTCHPLEKAPIYIDDTPNISAIELKSKARKLVKENGVKLIVIDYLQLMRSGLNIQNREQEIAEISRALKNLAKELDIPIIALSQLSRGVEARTDKKPMLSDLRESGQIEQDADMVIFCYRPEYYGINDYQVGSESFETHGLFMFLVAKHRNGELGEIPLTFIHEQTKLVNHGYNNPTPIQNNDTFVQREEEPKTEIKEPGKIEENNDFLSQTGDSDTNGDESPF